MSIIEQGRKVFRKVIFGDTFLPQEFFLGLADPQTEISVWLHGLATPLDVTDHHSMACAAPFTVCIAFDKNEIPNEKDLKRLTLKFCERSKRKRVLGEIGLRWIEVMHQDGLALALFEAQSSANYCLPAVRLWAHYLFHAYSQWRKPDTSDVRMSLLEKRASMVMFIRPHPVSLVSLVGEAGGNIFPMNLMGNLGDGVFAFALKDSRRAAHLVERAGRIALSSVPLQHAPLAYRLAVNHTKDSIDWNQLPFATKVSPTFHIPIPEFTYRVREMEVIKVRNIGSHTFFLARIVREETFSENLGLCVIHGFYQAWRLNGRSAELRASRAEDALYKRGA